MVLLALESENGAVLTYRLNKSQFSVGSSSRNDVVVRGPGIAERHLVMQRSGGAFTFVTTDRQTVVLNGERRSRGVLNPGDRVRLGSMTLIFRGGDAAAEEQPQPPAPVAASVRAAADAPVILCDPAGFPEARARLVEVLESPRSDCFQRLVGVIHGAVPGADIAVLLPSEAGDPVALASVWSGELPLVPAATLAELSSPGHYAQLVGREGAVIVVPVATAAAEVVGVLAAKPAGALGSEGAALVCEAARLLGLRWRHIGRDRVADDGWEAEARRRVEDDVPGTSQAAQVLRAGILAAAYGSDPALVCGSEGVGRTEVARLLAGVARRGGPEAFLVDARDGEDALRRNLFGASARPSLIPGADGALARAAGATLIVRNADAAPLSLQAELAALIGSQCESAAALPARWIFTCAENPLALVQQGTLAGALFQVCSRHLVRVPRLAERREDLPLLVAFLLRRVAAEQGKQLRGVTLECLNSLLAHPFQGELAELVGEVNRLVTATPDGEMVRCEGLARGGLDGGGGDLRGDGSQILSSDSLKVTVPRVERLLIDRVMRRVKGNQSKGAQLLGISRGALIAKLKEYQIPDYRRLKKLKAVRS
jgi:two-component system nitrogen regulation response regulator NtrX